MKGSNTSYITKKNTTPSRKPEKILVQMGREISFDSNSRMRRIVKKHSFRKLQEDQKRKCRYYFNTKY